MDNNFLSIRDFGAIGDGHHDDAPAMQSTIDAAVVERKTVFIPDGMYRMKQGVNVPIGVNIQGVTAATTGPWQNFLDSRDKGVSYPPESSLTGFGAAWADPTYYRGSWILVDHDVGNADGNPTFRMDGNTSICKLGFVHLNLPPFTNTVEPCPPAIGAISTFELKYSRDGIAIDDISLANCYIGIAFNAGSCTEDLYDNLTAQQVTASFGRHRIHNVMGGPIYKGITIKGVLDTIDVANIQFNFSCYEHYYLKARATMCTDLEIIRADGINFSNILSFGAFHGLRTRSGYNHGIVSLRANNLNLEGAVPLALETGGQYEINNSYFLTLNFSDFVDIPQFSCVKIDTDSCCIHQSFILFSNCMFQDGHGSNASSDVPLDISLDNGHNIQFSSCMFWGWNCANKSLPVIRFTHKPDGIAGPPDKNGQGAASCTITNSTFTSQDDGVLAEAAGDGYHDGELRFVCCRFPKSLSHDSSASLIKYTDCAVFNVNGEIDYISN